MNKSPLFAFTPRGERIECNAFSSTFKALALVITTMALAWVWQMFAAGHLEPTVRSSGWVGAALCMMLYTEWHILKGKTTLDNRALRQTWVWEKRVALNDLAYAKLIRVRGLEWLIAPRLYTKTFSNKLAVFYASSPAMLDEFKSLEVTLQAQREQC